MTPFTEIGAAIEEAAWLAHVHNKPHCVYQRFDGLMEVTPEIVNNQDMTISVWVFPKEDISQVSLELLAAIKQGYLTVKVAGVWAGDIQTPSIETPFEGARFFGFDMDNEYIAGFDDGAWEKTL